MSLNKDRFFLHREPVWRDRANFVINAPLAEEGEFEQLWSKQVSEDSFEICCIPFFLYDVALGDVVRTTTINGRRYIVNDVAERSGRYVFRVFFASEMRQNREPTFDALAARGALLEWSSPGLL